MTPKLLLAFVLLLIAKLEGTNSLNATTQKVINEVTQPSVSLDLNATTSHDKITPKGLGNQTTDQISTVRSTTVLVNESTTTKSVTENEKKSKSTTISDIESEIKEIFKVDSNKTMETSEEDEFNSTTTTTTTTTIVNCHETNSTNLICLEQNFNETDKTTYTLVAEAMESSEYQPAFRLQKSAAIAAGVFLLSAIAGYLSCVTYRRHLQRKYGNSQRLAPEDVYDTTDLRYFEI